MKMRLVTMMNGRTVIDKYGRDGMTAEELAEIAECEVGDGYADYAVVLLEGGDSDEIYAEFCA